MLLSMPKDSYYLGSRNIMEQKWSFYTVSINFATKFFEVFLLK